MDRIHDPSYRVGSRISNPPQQISEAAPGQGGLENLARLNIGGIASVPGVSCVASSVTSGAGSTCCTSTGISRGTSAGVRGSCRSHALCHSTHNVGSSV